MRVDETNSTNNDMAAMLGDERARGLTIVADYQRSGSGRKARSWIAPRGSALLCTIGLPDPLPASTLWIVPFWIALCVREALTGCGVQISLQWPNDLLLAGAKCGGILCISRVTGESAWAGCGIGLNLRRPDDLGELACIEPPPAFIEDVREIDRDAVLHAILAAADRRYEQLRDPAAVRRAWQTAAGVPGVRYRLKLDCEAEPFDATALALAENGSLLVESGRSRRLVALADAQVLR